MSIVFPSAQEKWEQSRIGNFTMEPTKQSTLNLLRGINLATDDQYQRYPKVANEHQLGLANLKTGYHSISPFAVHEECMSDHLILATPIPMGEVRFL